MFATDFPHIENLTLNRHGLDVLVHPLTDNSYDDSVRREARYFHRMVLWKTAHALMIPRTRSYAEFTAVSVTPRYAPISDWCALSGMSRSSTYEALGRGELRAIKVGRRTLIDVEAALAWMASMPVAKITTGRKRYSGQVPTTAPAGRSRQPEAPAG